MSNHDPQPERDEALAAFREKLAKAAGVPAAASASDRADEPAESVKLPPQPKTIEELGLSQGLVTDLILRILHYTGAPTAAQLVKRTALHVKIVQQTISTLRDERLIEVFGTSDLHSGNYRYRLTERGTERAKEALEQTKYGGPAPVTIEQYRAVVSPLLARSTRGDRLRLEAMLGELVLSPRVADAVARALASGKTGIFYGPSGNGKSEILQRFAQNLGGDMLVPHAIYAHGQVIRVFDPSAHERLRGAEAAGSKLSDELATDDRWVAIRRPAIVLGAELGAQSLDLTYDPQARMYQAPPHIKAQGGALIVDDLGRQSVPAQELLTRWLIPLERKTDKLTFVTGETIAVPFHAALLFATNAQLSRLADESMRRRILYKVHIPAPTAAEFMELLRLACRERRVTVAEGAVEHAVDRIYGSDDSAPRASHARDLIDMLVEAAAFDGRTPVFEPRAFDLAHELFFAPGPPSPEAALDDVLA